VETCRLYVLSQDIFTIFPVVPTCSKPFVCNAFLTDTTKPYALIVVVISGSNWVNPEDPNVIAENELLGAAAAIEAAARKLAELKPKPRPKVKPPTCVEWTC